MRDGHEQLQALHDRRIVVVRQLLSRHQCADELIAAYGDSASEDDHAEAVGTALQLLARSDDVFVANAAMALLCGEQLADRDHLLEVLEDFSRLLSTALAVAATSGDVEQLAVMLPVAAGLLSIEALVREGTRPCL